jgi:long-chain acyl-CoA synthetase
MRSPLAQAGHDGHPQNVAANLVRTAEVHGERPAVRSGQVSMTYHELDEASARTCTVLRSHGVAPGDRVGIMLPNVIEFAVTYFGALRAGAVVVPMNPLLKRREVGYYLSDSQARLLLAWHVVADEARAGAGRAGTGVIVVDPADSGTLAAAAPATGLAERSPADTAVILYTSGTTGAPKGAELTHANLTANADVVRRDLFRLGPDDVVLGALPLFHSFGQVCCLNAPVSAGASVSLIQRFDAAQVLRVMAEHKVTIFPGVPTMHVALLSQPDLAEHDLSALRVCMSGGAAMPAEVIRRVERAFGAPVLEGYGLSETSPAASFNHPDRVRKPGSVGTPIRGVQMRIVDDNGAEVPHGQTGEIVIRGHNVMKGYWRRPEETSAAIRDGWFRTGDIGRVDQDGYVYIVDRKKDLIIRGGYNVYPREIEEVLYEHPAVAEAAVVAIPHPELGQEVAAAVVLKPGAHVTPEELRDHIKTQVAAYKYPRVVWITDALPKGPSGKIVKREIEVPPSVLRR